MPLPLLTTRNIVKSEWEGVALGASADEDVATFTIRREINTRFIRILIQVSGYSTNASTATLYHGLRDETKITTAKTVSITGNGDFYITVSATNDTSLVPLMPDLTVNVTTQAGGDITVDAVKIVHS